MTMRQLLAAFLLSLSACIAPVTDSSADGFAAPVGETASPKVAWYPLANCVVSGKRLDTGAVAFAIGNRVFRVCCDECKDTIAQDPELWARQVDAANIKEQLLHYPMTTCVVSGKALGERVTTVMHGNTLLRTCCAGCKETLLANPTPFLIRLATANSASFGNVDLGCADWNEEQTASFLAEQATEYPLTTCPISGKPLEQGKSVGLLLEGTLVRVCCDDCVAQARTDATRIVTEIQAAAFAAQKTSYPLTSCAISGKPLGDRAASTMVGVTLVRTCTTTCGNHVGEQRAAIVETIRQARTQATKAANASCCGTGDDCCCAEKR